MAAGVYIHIPFCRSRCSYCDFATDVWRTDESVDLYVNALIREIETFENGSEADTIYFGGGTPSLLKPAQVERILKTVRTKFPVVSGSEITMEMNPATVTLETLEAYRGLGVNRASFGAQTFDDVELKRLGRKHTAADVRETIELLRRSGFENVSFDLIAGLPRQTTKDWERNLDEALKLLPEHLSLYLLEVHEGTPLAEQIRTKRQPQPDEDLAGEMYEIMIDRAAAAGYLQYEISNFSVFGRESRHNSKYWLCEPVYGFGVSAHSFDGRVRWSNQRDTNQYVGLLEKGESPIVDTTPLSAEQIAGEFAFLNLRLTKGLDPADFASRFGFDLLDKYASDLHRLSDWGLIDVGRNFLRLTRHGMVYSNEVFSVFV
jgi:oxygen-independent coproporphyrinogen III oxidase